MNSRAKNKSIRRSQIIMSFALILTASGLLHGQNASPVSVSTLSGSGPVDLFTATYTDPVGGSDIAEAVLDIMNNVVPGTPGWSANECLLRYDLSTNNVWLVPNDGGVWSGPVTAGQSQTLGNFQCTVLAYGASAQISGNTVTVNFLVSFTNNFTGLKQLYMSAEDASGAWSTNFTQQFGSYNVTTVPLRSWSTFYPMNRGQGRGNRAGAPWMSFAGQNGSIGAQLTWDLPGGLVAGDSPDGVNRPNAAFPTFVAAWPNYYPGHTPEYYLNWWCQQLNPQTQQHGPQVFDPSQHNCNDVTDYEELITEVPGLDGTTAALLGLWAQGAQSSYTVNYDVGVCDLLASADPSADGALSLPSRSLPLLFGLPAGGTLTLPSGAQAPVSTYVGPPVCRVNFNNSVVRGVANVNGYSKAYIATTVFADFQTAHGHVVEAVNYYYDAPFTGRNCVPGLPQNSPVMLNDSIQIPGACVDAMEAYYMIDATGLVSYDPRLINGMSAWGGIDPSGNFNNSYWDADHGWDGYGSSPPPQPLFSYDSCTFVSGSTSVLSCQ